MTCPLPPVVPLADPYGRTTYTHDVQSRLTKIQNPLNEVTTIQWDALDREQNRVLGNGGAVSHVYDAGGRETVLQNISAAGVAQAVFTNAYDALANRLSVIELDNTRVSFGYDKTSQIVNEQRTGANAYNTTYVWDPLGNRLQEINTGLTATRTFSPTNSQLTSVPPSGPATTNTWDANGNLAVTNTGGALTTSTWDPENRLSRVDFSDGTSESYLTSQDGLRKSKTTGSGTTVYTWDDENVLLETNTSNVVQARFTDYPGYWGGLSSQNRSGVSSFFFFDTQGSTRVLTSILGLITDVYSYMSFGIELQSGSGTLNDLRYIGKFGYKRERRNVNLARRRILFSIDGQWDRRDPIGIRSGDVNNLRYCTNNPITVADPSGLLSTAPVWDTHWAIGSCTGKNTGPTLAPDRCCCGAYRTYWKWALKFPNKKCDGWIVQQVTLKRHVDVNCDGTGQDDTPVVWYEAWHVSELGTPPFGNGNYHDSLFFSGIVGVCGWHSLSAEAKFYCDPHNGSALGISKATWSDPGCSPNAGDTYCTTSKPMWWGDSSDNGEGSSTHWARADKWNCCGTAKAWTSNTSASAYPKNKPAKPCDDSNAAKPGQK